MSTERKSGPCIASEWLALALIVIVIGLVALCMAAFNGDFSRSLAVTLTADRSGLVMEPNAKVKMRGVEVTDDEAEEARKYAADTGGTVVPLPLPPPDGYTTDDAGNLIPLPQPTCAGMADGPQPEPSDVTG